MKPCSNVYRFHDEELNGPEAEAFSAHLRDCAPCREELRMMAILDAQAARVLLAGDKPPMWPLAVLAFASAAVLWLVLTILLGRP